MDAAAFKAAGVALLVTAREVGWGDLHAVLTRALAIGDEAPRSPEALADATAARAGGPVTIEDLQGRLLAYSAGGQDLDPARAATVLGRRAPERWRAELRRAE